MSRAPALYTQHQRLAAKIAHEFYFPGADRDDVNQEARIGLWDAARAYNPARGRFPSFAAVVIRRRLKDRLRHHLSQAQLFLTDSARDHEIDGGDQTVRAVLGREHIQLVLDLLPTLSDLEREALTRAVNGQGCSEKKLDNALQRARRKLAA